MPGGTSPYDQTPRVFSEAAVDELSLTKGTIKDRRKKH